MKLSAMALRNTSTVWLTRMVLRAFGHFSSTATGTYHKMSNKHLGQYVNEFAGCYNIRPLDTMTQMATVARSLVGKRLSYADLIMG